MKWHATSRRAAVVMVIMLRCASADAQVRYDIVAAFDRPWPDGASPRAGLIQGTDGNFYGTTSEGGTSGAGIVFKIDVVGTFTALHRFSVGDGAFPYAAPIQAIDGSFYGTTRGGGVHGCGTVFKIDAAGTLTTLYSFSGSTDGAEPYAGLTEGSDGNFYGTTSAGGAHFAG